MPSYLVLLATVQGSMFFKFTNKQACLFEWNHKMNGDKEGYYSNSCSTARTKCI